MLRDFENKQNSDTVTRREFVQAGGLGVLGMGLADGLTPGQARAAQPRAATLTPSPLPQGEGRGVRVSAKPSP